MNWWFILLFSLIGQLVTVNLPNIYFKKAILDANYAIELSEIFSWHSFHKE